MLDSTTMTICIFIILLIGQNNQFDFDEKLTKGGTKAFSHENQRGDQGESPKIFSPQSQIPHRGSVLGYSRSDISKNQRIYPHKTHGSSFWATL
jgi:hypothetical protein